MTPGLKIEDRLLAMREAYPNLLVNKVIMMLCRETQNGHSVNHSRQLGIFKHGVTCA